MAHNVIHLSENTIENLINGPQNQQQLESSVSVTNLNVFKKHILQYDFFYNRLSCR